MFGKMLHHYPKNQLFSHFPTEVNPRLQLTRRLTQCLRKGHDINGSFLMTKGLKVDRYPFPLKDALGIELITINNYRYAKTGKAKSNRIE